MKTYTSELFQQVYGPAGLITIAMHEVRAHIGEGPTVAQSIDSLGIDVVRATIRALIDDLATFSIAKIEVSDSLVDNVICLMRYKKMAEVSLFFQEYKTGRFGRIYNTIYPTELLTNLRDWRIFCTTISNELTYEHRMNQLDRR